MWRLCPEPDDLSGKLEEPRGNFLEREKSQDQLNPSVFLQIRKKGMKTVIFKELKKSNS